MSFTFNESPGKLKVAIEGDFIIITMWTDTIPVSSSIAYTPEQAEKLCEAVMAAILVLRKRQQPPQATQEGHE